MEIIFFNESATLSGGVERVVCFWANYFANRNDEVTILNVHGEGAFYPLDERVQVKTLGIEVPSEGFRKFIRYYRIISALRKFLKSRRPQFFVANSAALGCCSLIAGRFLKDQGPKTIICDHNSFVSVSKMWSAARKFLYRNAYAVISLTKSDLPKYHRIGAPAVHIPNPLPWRNSSVAKKNSQVALAVGRFTRQKGFDLLLESWKGVAEKYPGWTLEVVGSGEEEGNLVEQRARLQLEKNVKFVPSKPHIHENYLGASLFISSSRFEGLPMVLIEAKSFGLPCVAFDCETGPREILRDGIDGYLAKPEDVADLTAKIIALISEPGKIQEFGKRAAEDSLRFTPEHVMKLWEEMLSTRPVASLS